MSRCQNIAWSNPAVVAAGTVPAAMTFFFAVDPKGTLSPLVLPIIPVVGFGVDAMVDSTATSTL
jgi:hypothetical protein